MWWPDKLMAGLLNSRLSGPDQGLYSVFPFHPGISFILAKCQSNLTKNPGVTLCLQSTTMIPLRIADWTLLVEKALKTGASCTCKFWPDTSYTCVSINHFSIKLHLHVCKQN